MQIGWDSRTDTFFVSGLTDEEAGALQGTIASTYQNLALGEATVEGPTRLGDEGYKEFLNDLQAGLYKAKLIRESMV